VPLFDDRPTTTDLLSKTRIEAFCPNVWTQWIPYRFCGLSIGTRMTVVRLPDGNLWIHTPLKMERKRVDELSALGQIKYLICPNRLHDLYPNDLEVLPDIEGFASPRLYDLHKVPWKGNLGVARELPWSGVIAQRLIRGSRWMDEVVFFHLSLQNIDLG
jgi:hypothetical protein